MLIYLFCVSRYDWVKGIVVRSFSSLISAAAIYGSRVVAASTGKSQPAPSSLPCCDFYSVRVLFLDRRYQECSMWGPRSPGRYRSLNGPPGSSTRLLLADLPRTADLRSTVRGTSMRRHPHSRWHPSLVPSCGRSSTPWGYFYCKVLPRIRAQYASPMTTFPAATPRRYSFCTLCPMTCGLPPFFGRYSTP